MESARLALTTVRHRRVRRGGDMCHTWGYTSCRPRRVLQEGGRVTDSNTMRHPRPGSPRATLRAWMARRQRDERGATLVEAAFVMPVFVLMIFGIFEFSGYVMARTGANAAVKGGLRMAVVTGSDDLADRNIVNRMQAEGAGLQKDEITQVVIWRAANTHEGPPADCTSLTSGYHTGIWDNGNDDIGACNVYNDPDDPVHGVFAKAKLPVYTGTGPPPDDTADYWFGCDATAAPESTNPKYDCNWSPAHRRILEKAPDFVGTCTGRVCDPTDLIGVAITVDHQMYTRFFGSHRIVDEHSVAPIEPQGYDR